LWQKNAVALSKEIMALAEKNLAPGAVIGYELGNEVSGVCCCAYCIHAVAAGVGYELGNAVRTNIPPA
jgi:hypothetical protein